MMSMSEPSKEGTPASTTARAESVLTLSNQHRLLAYVASLELEVDRLRRQNRFLHGETEEMIRRVHEVCSEGKERTAHSLEQAEVSTALRQLAELLRDVMEDSSHDAAHDQVTAISVRPLI